MTPPLSIIELDNAYRIDDARGRALVYVYWSGEQFPLLGKLTKEEAYEIAGRCLYALGAEK